MARPPPCSPLFPYTTLFRSLAARGHRAVDDPVVRSERLAAGTADQECRDGRATALEASRERIEPRGVRSEEHTSELQSRFDLVCRLLLEKKKEKQRHGGRAT